MDRHQVVNLEQQIDKVLSHIESLIKLNESEKEYFISLLKFKRVRKRQYTQQIGDVCRYKTLMPGHPDSYRDRHHILKLKLNPA